MAKTLMVSTCGTSVLTNLARGDAALGKLIRASANSVSGSPNAGTGEKVTEDERSAISRAEELCRDILSRGSVDEVREVSAELNGLLGFYDNQLDRAQGDVHILLHSDTVQGEAVAEMLREYLAGNKVNVSVQSFDDLRTDTVKNFESGLAGVIRWCQETLPGYRASQYHIVFNLTGGFKSIQGWMQTLGMFYADEIIYIFERSSELLRIPRIPVNIEAAATEAVRHHLPFFRRMGQAGAFCPAGHKPDGLAETFLYRVGDEIELSPWGRLIWDQSKKMLYREKLLGTPSDAIVYSERFRQAAAQRTPDELHHVNERLDDFAAYLQDPNANLNRLDPRGLRGNPLPPSTHEFNAWAQRPAWRVFYHDENGRKILDDLRPGLH